MITIPDIFQTRRIALSGNTEVPTLRTDSKDGLLQQKGRFATHRETYDVTWILQYDEMDDFKEMFEDTLEGGVLLFGLELPEDGEYTMQPVRFVGGKYNVTHRTAFFYTVTATVEKMTVTASPANHTPPVPPWLSLDVNPAISQELTLSHRNALLTVTPGDGNITTLQIYPPTDATQYIYFGIKNIGLGDALITSEGVDPLEPPAVQVWPSELPGVNRMYQYEAERQTHRLEMDSGHARQFNRFPHFNRSSKVSFDFTLEQLETFRDFFFVTLESGTLPFTITLPIDGTGSTKTVKIAEGKFDESYQPVDMFRVTMVLEHIPDQTVEPLDVNPYGVLYSPSVAVSANIELEESDAGKMFVCNPGAGETLRLYISDLEIEFGVLVIGLGDVRITRIPIDADADAWVDDMEAAGATITSAHRHAIYDFVAGEKAAGFFDDIISFRLPIWGIAAANIKDLRSNAAATWNGTITHASGYVQGDGSSGYLNTEISPAVVWGTTDFGAGFLALTDVTANRTSCGCRDTSSTTQFFISAGAHPVTLNLARTFGGSTANVVTTKGLIYAFHDDTLGTPHIIAKRNSGFVDGGNPVASGAVPSNDFYFMAWNNQGTAATHESCRFGAFFMTKKTTTANAERFLSAIEALFESITTTNIP